MSLSTRKLVVVFLIVSIVAISNMLLITQWLSEKGVVDWAHHMRAEYLTGTALTIIVVLLVLLVRPKAASSRWLRRCPVCDNHRIGRGHYCTECGSKI